MVNKDLSLSSIPFFELLRNPIDITGLPLCDRGSRLNANQSLGEGQRHVKLAEPEPGIDADMRRPPIIRVLPPIDPVLGATAELLAEPRQLPNEPHGSLALV